MKPLFAALLALALTAPALPTSAWAEEDLPIPTHWGGTGAKATADEETGTITFGDGQHGARPAKQTETEEQFTPDGTPIRAKSEERSKVQVRGWNPEKKQD